MAVRSDCTTAQCWGEKQQHQKQQKEKKVEVQEEKRRQEEGQKCVLAVDRGVGVSWSSWNGSNGLSVQQWPGENNRQI